MKNILHKSDPQAGGGTTSPAMESPAQTIARLSARNQELEAQVAATAAAEAEHAAEERLIEKKMKAGLSREQAIAVIKRQKSHDEAIAKQWATRCPKIVEILKENLSDRTMRHRVRELDASITLDEINAAKESM